MTGTLPAPGDAISREQLTVARARGVADLIVSAWTPYTSLVECRRRVDAFAGDVLVLQVEVELPQHRPRDIRDRELVAVTFLDDDSTYPEVEALRADFPQVPHLNMRASAIPKSLCLYEEPWEALKLHWSPGAYIERIREWLAQTACDDLHAADQALEPFFLSSYGTFVLSETVFQAALGDSLDSIAVSAREAGGGRTVFLAEVSSDPGAGMEASFIPLAVMAQPRTAGVIRRTPATLGALHDLLKLGGDDLAETLRERLAPWIGNKEVLEKHLILLLAIPKTRSEGGAEEALEMRAFLTRTSLAKIGIAVGLWEEERGVLGRVLGSDGTRVGYSVELDMLNVVHSLSRERAAGLNGIGSTPTLSVVAVGVGALGSQACLNLARSGWGQWTYVDIDHVLPHNLARHALPGYCVGMPKAPALAFVANSIIEGGTLAVSIVADVLRPDSTGEQVRESLSGADLIVDMSASVPVGRALVHDFDSDARRISAFLNPTGTDLVVLAEDEAREIPVDSLEMQYYRSLIERADLSEHLARPEEGLRYGQACRDVSFLLSQEVVALHAAIGARLVREISGQPGASISIHRLDPTSLTVSRVNVAPSPVIVQQIGEWRLVADEALLNLVGRLRQERLPNETGGVLVGSIDTQRRVVYVAIALPSPSDSEERPASYIRGTRGLAEQVTKMSAITQGEIEYVGEWHSHPDGSGVALSDDDKKALHCIAELREPDGRPAVFLIVGEGEAAWHIE